MNEYLPVIIMFNNYFHDLATAFLGVSAFMLLAIKKHLLKNKVENNREIYIKAFHYLSKLALISLAWIILGGIPRTIFFKKYEWWDAVVKGVVAALVMQHIIMFAVTGVGIYIWVCARKEIKTFEIQ